MARCSVAGRSTVAGTTVRAVASVFAIAGTGFNLVQCSVFNTVAVAVAVALVRFTNATGVGAALTEVCDSNPDYTVLMTGFAGHTADGAVNSPHEQASLGAAIGSGVIWTFGNGGILIPKGTANGIGIICPTGTGQILDYAFKWDE